MSKTDKANSQRTTIWLDKDLLQKVDEKNGGRTRSFLIRTLLEKFIESTENQEIVEKQDTNQNGSLFKKLAKGFYNGFDELFKSTTFPNSSKGLMFDILSRHLDMNEVQQLKMEIKNGGME